MMTREALIALDRSLDGKKVLSAYLGSAESDPAERTSWRRSLAERIDELRDQLLGRPRSERDAFEACVTHLMDRLAGIVGFLPSPGWVAFVTRQEVKYAEALPVPMPVLVAWDDGMRLAPYIHALEEQRPAIVAVLDGRTARVLRYAFGHIHSVELHRVHARVLPVIHMGNPPAAGFHSGTRGVTGSDEAERERRAGRERMLRELAARLTALSVPDTWVFFGGIPQVMREAVTFLPNETRARAHRLMHLDVHATDAKIAARVARKIAELRSQRASDVVDQIIARSGNAANAVTGGAPTREALVTGAVDLLCLTERFAREHTRDAEVAIRAALSRQADVEVVDGTPAQRFDGAAGGIGARLRFVPWQRTGHMSTDAAG
jgi:Bacterial archaeo-eukaryotic release factor family 10